MTNILLVAVILIGLACWALTSTRGQKKNRFALVSLESLEDRLAPAILTWKGGVDGDARNWHNPDNWEESKEPTAQDVVKIGFAGANSPIASGVCNAKKVDINHVGTLTVTGSLSTDYGTWNQGAKQRGQVRFLQGVLDPVCLGVVAVVLSET